MLRRALVYYISFLLVDRLTASPHIAFPICSTPPLFTYLLEEVRLCVGGADVDARNGAHASLIIAHDGVMRFATLRGQTDEGLRHYAPYISLSSEKESIRH